MSSIGTADGVRNLSSAQPDDSKVEPVIAPELDDERHFRAIAETALDAIVTATSDGRIVYLNPAAERLFGLRADLRGRPFTALMPERYHAAREAGFGRFFATGEARVLGKSIELVGMRADGSEFPLELSLSRWEANGSSFFTGILRDISERKLVERALEQQNVLIQQLVGDAVLGLDEQLNVTAWNRGAEQVYGWCEEEVLGRMARDVLQPEYPDTTRAEVIGALALGGQWRGHLRARRKDGREVDVEVAATASRDETGKIISMLAVHHDVTSQRAAEHELRRLAAIVESSDDAIIGETLAGIITSWNDAAARLFGYAATEAIGKPVRILIPAERAEEQARVVERLRKGERVEHFETVGVRKDGRRIDVAVTISPILDSEGIIVGASKIARDITEEKRLREKLEMQARVLDHMLEGVSVSDEEGFIVYTNPAEDRMFGYGRGELIGRHVMTQNAYPSEENEQIVRAIIEELQQRGVWAGEFLNKKKDGTSFFTLARISTVEWGAKKHWVCVQADVTELKRAQEALARSNQELEQYAYVVSHDLQEPIRMIRSYLQLLEKEYKGRLDAQADKYIHYAVDGAARMQSLVRDLLALSRVDSRARPALPTNADSVLIAALLDLEAMISESGGVVTHDALPTVLADGSQLRLVFQNLISNAIKFRKRDELPRIHVSAERIGSAWVFSVRDNGIGIDPAHGERIFRIFQRLHGRAEYPGSGIGLSISKKVVERGGGRIWVETTGNGSIFRFTTPAVTGESG